MRQDDDDGPKFKCKIHFVVLTKTSAIQSDIAEMSYPYKDLKCLQHPCLNQK